MNALGVNEVDNEVLNDADQYLREHKILELFEVRSRHILKVDACIFEKSDFGHLFSNRQHDVIASYEMFNEL